MSECCATGQPVDLADMAFLLQMDLYNGTQLANATAEPTAPVFDDFALLKTVILSVIAVVSFAGNLATLISIRCTQKTRSTVYLLISHLSIADVLVSLFCATTEALWTYTVQWYAGTFMCKLIKYLQMFSLYLSTFILVLIGIDRFVAVRYPMRRSDAHRRCLYLIVAIWVFSAVLSIPQMAIFSVLRGPFEEDFYQCVTYGFYTAKWQEQLYTTISLVFMFILPLFTLITTYICTFCSIARSEGSFGGEETFQSKAGLIRRKLLRKAKTKSLQLTVVIVLAFVVCWTPYHVMMIVFMFLDPDERLSEEMQSGIFFFGMSNSMVNPLIYGAFHLHKSRRRRLGSSRHVSMQSTINTGVSFRSNNRHAFQAIKVDEPSTVTIVDDVIDSNDALLLKNSASRPNVLIKEFNMAPQNGCHSSSAHSSDGLEPLNESTF